jgi:hypothetical protein
LSVHKKYQCSTNAPRRLPSPQEIRYSKHENQ